MNEYKSGDYNVSDDMFGRKLKRSQCRMRWDNILVPIEDWEERHPMDFLRVQKDRQKVPEPRVESVRFEQTPVEPSDL
jgi:hypothetical protein